MCVEVQISMLQTIKHQWVLILATIVGKLNYIFVELVCFPIYFTNITISFFYSAKYLLYLKMILSPYEEKFMKFDNAFIFFNTYKPPLIVIIAIYSYSYHLKIFRDS